MNAALGIGLSLAIALGAINPAAQHAAAPSVAPAVVPAVALAATPAPVTLDRTGWTVTASHSHPDTPASNMLDGTVSTGWTSGKGQQAFPEDPEFIVLDTHEATTFDTIELAAGAAVDDYARSYAVSVSDDGSSWTPVTSGNGSLTNGALIVSVCGNADPCEPVTARFIRFEQTSWHYVNWWTIAELNLLVREAAPAGGPAQFLDRTGWSMTASQGWLPAANMLDGTVDTGWTTGDGQAAGQWIRLDAGAPVTFDAIDLAAGAAVNDFARGYAVDVSPDGNTWTPVASGTGALNADGSLRISLCDDVATCTPATGRYVRITQTSNHFVNAWTVAEFNLVIGDLAYLAPQATPRETMVAPGATVEVDVWGLAPHEPVRFLAENGSLIVSDVADEAGELTRALTVPNAEGDFAFSVAGDWTGWRADLEVLVTSDVEGTDPDPNQGTGECAPCAAGGAPFAAGALEITEEGGTISLDWPDVAGADEYEVLRSTGRYSVFSAVATVDGSDFSDPVGAEQRYDYYYKVVAIEDDERSAPSADASLEAALFGENVHVFSPTDDAAEIDALVAGTNAKMFPFASELSDDRYAFAFKPGDYDTATINIGYYTSVYGLGETPLDTTVPRIEIPSQPADALTNFWRSVENIGIDTGSADTHITWATSQAAPARRLWVNGKLHLDDWGKAASGGYLADSVITGETGSWSQQQYFLRNNDLTRGWYGGGWNHVFVGNENPPAESSDWAAAGWNATTVEAETPAVREKPFLYLADSGDYEVFVPGLRESATGVSWSEGDPGLGDSLPIGDFHVARAGVDTAATMNAALAGGKHLLLTPGVYEIDETLQVEHADTVVLGLGMATLRPVGGIDAMHVADVGGVTIAGVLFDATADGSERLLQVGEADASADHSANPTLLADVFTRVGGAVDGKARTTLEINSSDVIGDHFWLWRADHGVGGTGWDKNTGANGLVVNGDRVTVYGLFVEHFQEYQTLWNGDDGATYFYQSELPYDPPTQADYLSHDGTVNGYASYKVTNEASNHYAVGLGVYDVFIHTDEWVVVENGIEVSPGTELRHAAIVSFGAGGGQNHIVNGVGAGVSGGAAIKSGINSYVEPIPLVRATVTELTGTATGGDAGPAAAGRVAAAAVVQVVPAAAAVEYRDAVQVRLELVEGSNATVQQRIDGGDWTATGEPVQLTTPGQHRVDYRVLHLGDVYDPASGGVDVTIAAPGTGGPGEPGGPGDPVGPEKPSVDEPTPGDPTPAADGQRPIAIADTGVPFDLALIAAIVLLLLALGAVLTLVRRRAQAR